MHPRRCGDGSRLSRSAPGRELARHRDIRRGAHEVRHVVNQRRIVDGQRHDVGSRRRDKEPAEDRMGVDRRLQCRSGRGRVAADRHLVFVCRRRDPRQRDIAELKRLCLLR